MISRNLLSVPLLVLLVVFSCDSENDKIMSTIDFGIKETGFSSLLEKDYLVVVPRTGCTGCIDSVEEFLMTDAYRYHEKINVLLTDVVSLKTAKIKLGEELITADFVFIDKESDFYTGVLASMYPMILYLQNGIISYVAEVSPKNSNAMDEFISSLTD